MKQLFRLSLLCTLLLALAGLATGQGYKFKQVTTGVKVTANNGWISYVIGAVTIREDGRRVYINAASGDKYILRPSEIDSIGTAAASGTTSAVVTQLSALFTGGSGSIVPYTALTDTNWNLGSATVSHNTLTLTKDTTIHLTVTDGQEAYLWVTGAGHKLKLDTTYATDTLGSQMVGITKVGSTVVYFIPTTWHKTAPATGGGGGGGGTGTVLLTHAFDVSPGSPGTVGGNSEVLNTGEPTYAKVTVSGTVHRIKFNTFGLGPSAGELTTAWVSVIRLSGGTYTVIGTVSIPFASLTQGGMNDITVSSPFATLNGDLISVGYAGSSTSAIYMYPIAVSGPPYSYSNSTSTPTASGHTWTGDTPLNYYIPVELYE